MVDKERRGDVTKEVTNREKSLQSNSVKCARLIQNLEAKQNKTER